MFISMKKNEYSIVFTNLLVVGLFLFANPFIALLLCAIISSLHFKINYFIFTTSFIISWTLYHFMRDFTASGGDVIPYIGIYHSSIDESIYIMISRFIDAPVQNEPLWRIFNKIVGFFVGYNASFYVFFVYLIIFQLVSILGYVVDKQKFAIIIFFMFFLNLGVLYNIFHVWRHTIAVLLFAIGIYLNYTNRNKIISRILIYSSPFIQLVTLPLIILYHSFNFLNKSNKVTGLSKLFNSGAIIYCLIFVLGIISFEVLFYSLVDIFNLSPFKLESVNKVTFSILWIVSPLSLMLIFTLYKKRFHLSRNEIFIGLTYYLLVITPLIITVVPSLLWGRMYYFALIGATIIVGQSFINNFKHLTLIIIAIGSYRFYTLSKDNIAFSFNYLGGGTPFDPSYGIISMIYKQYYKMPDVYSKYIIYDSIY